MKKDKIFAILLLLALSFLAYLLSNLSIFKAFQLSPLIIAILLGIIVANAFKPAVNLLKNSGILTIATKQILRLGIILFGFRLTLQDIYEVGFLGILIAFFVVFSTFFIGIFLGKRLGLDEKTSILISSGSSICGAAAVLAIQSTIRSNTAQVAIAVSTVVVFGTIGMFLYPVLFQSGILGFDANDMGIFTGASLHEVAHVIGAAAGMTDESQNSAVIMKMLRVLMLVPFLLMLGIWMFRQGGEGRQGVGNFVPYFALWFLFAVIIGSLPFFPREFVPSINFIDTILLGIAMSALGATINKDALSNAGFKPFLLAFMLFVWLFFSTFLMVKFWF